MQCGAKVLGGHGAMAMTTRRSLVVAPRAAASEASAQAEEAEAERFRLNNLSPQPGSKKTKKRIGRGYGAGQGGSAGKGMRGQNARSGGGTRPGFEGGQNPLYRRLPKLRGIAGGMGAGQKDYNVVNVGLLSDIFAEGDEVTLEALTERRVIDVSGRERSLPLKVLGDGAVDKKLVVKAAAFSKSAEEKIAAAGGEVVTLPGRKKWTRADHEASKKAAEE
ncbi:ribosomal protein L15 [Chloropicon roscoffensis]|uniref:Ribosomal protein L15 n=1 Tax=Chloropicon roscoffensis TaxID=1461544 RepID=A0AAX4PE10_9CHLO